MENIADALKLGFAMLVFAIALTVFFNTVSLARRVTESLIKDSDKTEYLTYLPESPTVDENGNRIVSLEDIQMASYRHYRESSAVTIIDKHGDIVARFDGQTEELCENWDKLTQSQRKTQYDQINFVLGEVDKSTTVTIGHEYDENAWKEIFLKIYCQIPPGNTSLKEMACPWIGKPELNAQRIDSDFSRNTSII